MTLLFTIQFSDYKIANLQLPLNIAGYFDNVPFPTFVPSIVHRTITTGSSL